LITVIKLFKNSYIPHMKENIEKKLVRILDFIKKQDQIVVKKTDTFLQVLPSEEESTNEKSIFDSSKAYYKIKTGIMKSLEDPTLKELRFKDFNEKCNQLLKEKIKKFLLHMIPKITSTEEKNVLKESFDNLSVWLDQTYQVDIKELTKIFDHFKILQVLEQRTEKLSNYKNLMYEEIQNIAKDENVSDKFSRIVQKIIEELNTHIGVILEFKNNELVKKLLEFDFISLHLISFMIEQYEKTITKRTLPFFNLLICTIIAIEDLIEKLLECMEPANIEDKDTLKTKFQNLYKIANAKEIELWIDLKNAM